MKLEDLAVLSTRFRRTVRLANSRDWAVIALVDIMFLLLIFFMMGSSLVFQPGINVNLPETMEEFIGVADKLVITVTKEGLLFFNDRRMADWEELDSQLAAKAYRRPGREARGRTPIIILKADRGVPYDDVVRVMSLTRGHGISVFLATEAAVQ